jgi:hypothetical protein
MRFSPPSVLALLATLALAAAQGRAAEASAPKVVKLPGPGSDFAINPETGALAVAYPDADKIVIYPDLAAKGDLSNAHEIKVAGGPSSIVFKQLTSGSVFAVICSQNQTIIVFDGASFAQKKSIPIHLENPCSLVASREPRDPYVYYCGCHGQQGALARINLETLENEGSVQLSSDMPVSEAVISADGSRAYLLGNWGGFVGVYAIEAPAKGERSPKARLLSWEQRRFSEVIPDTQGEFVAADSNGQEAVYSADFQREEARLDLRPLAFLDAQPYLLGLEGKRLAAVSTNDWKPAGSIALPIELPVGPLLVGTSRGPGNATPWSPGRGRPPMATPADAQRFTYHRRVLEAPKANAVLLCLHANVCIVPLAALNLPAQHFLAARIEGATDFVMGQRQELKVVPRDPAVQVRLESGPTGLVLEDRKLVWTPGETQVGTHTIKLGLSVEDKSRTRELVLRVRRPAIEVGFMVHDMRITPDGATAIVLGGNGQYAFQRGEKATLVLIDLKKMTQIVKRELPVGVQAIGIDGHYAYAGLSGSDTFYVLSKKDLSDVRRLFTNGRVKEFVSAADRLLFVATDSSVTVLRVPSLQAAEPADLGLGFHLGGRTAPRMAPLWLGTGWFYDGWLFDRELRKPLVAVQPGGFHKVLGPPAGSFGPGNQSPAPSWLSPWGAHMEYNALRQGQRAITTLQNQPFGMNRVIILPDQPAAVAVQVADQNQRSRKVEAVFYDLLTGTPSLQMPLMDETAGTQNIMSSDALKVEALRDTLVIGFADRLWVVKIPTLDRKQYPAPAWFDVTQPVNILGSEDKEIPVPALRGAVSPVEFSVRDSPQGIELAKDGSRLRLRAGALMSAAAETATLFFTRYDGSGSRLQDRMIDEYLRDVGPRFEKIAGRPAAGVPFWCTVGITARDANMQSADVEVGFFIDVPRRRLQETAEQKERAQQPIRVPDFPLRWMKSAPSARSGTPSDQIGDLQKRIGDLERTVKDLSQKIDRLTTTLERSDKPKELKR